MASYTKHATGLRRRVTESIVTNQFTGVQTIVSSEQQEPITVRRRTKSWVQTPNFRNLVRAGSHLPDNPFDWEDTELRAGRIRVVGKPVFGNPNKVQTIITDTSAQYAWQAHGSSIPGLDAQLRSKLISNMRGQQFNAPVAIAEAGQAINMVVQRATDLVGILRRLRRGDVSGAAGVLGLTSRQENKVKARYNRDYFRDPSKAAANAWLEMSYGWRPLLKDVQDATNTVMDTVDRDIDQVGSVRAVVKGRSSTVVRNETSSLCRFDRYIEIDDSRNGVWRFTPKLGFYPARFGILNPLTVAWELVPFSFVADWFLPIGDYLATFDTPFRVDHRGGTYGSFKTSQFTRVAVPHTDYVSANGVALSVLKVLKRTVMTAPPDLTLQDVRIDPKLGASRMFSAFALLRQGLRF